MKVYFNGFERIENGIKLFGVRTYRINEKLHFTRIYFDEFILKEGDNLTEENILVIFKVENIDFLDFIDFTARKGIELDILISFMLNCMVYKNFYEQIENLKRIFSLFPENKIKIFFNEFLRKRKRLVIDTPNIYDLLARELKYTMEDLCKAFGGESVEKFRNFLVGERKRLEKYGIKFNFLTF